MTQAELRQWIEQGESTHLEFKSSFNAKHIKTLVAFANTAGGRLVIGVNDDKKITGVSLGPETLQNWINEIKHNTAPQIIPNVEVHQLEGRDLVVFWVPEYPIKPLSSGGRYYKRIHNSTHVLAIEEIAQLHLQSQNSSWDYMEERTNKLEDLSLAKVNRFIDLCNELRNHPIDDDPLTVLRKLECIRGEHLTRGCFLLFMAGESMMTTIQCARISGKTSIKDQIVLRGDLLGQTHIVLEFIKKHMGKSAVISGRLQREERWDYPLDALREIIANMIVHRDYSSPLDASVRIYDDSIEFYNPGGLLGDMNVEMLLSGSYVSTARNKQISQLFREAGLIERYGSGVHRILESTSKAELSPPDFEERQGGFWVRMTHKGVLDTQKNVSSTVDTQKGLHVTHKPYRQRSNAESIKEDMLNLMKADASVTRDMMARSLGRSPNTIKKYLADLSHEGRIERSGGKKYGLWIVKA